MEISPFLRTLLTFLLITIYPCQSQIPAEFEYIPRKSKAQIEKCIARAKSNNNRIVAENCLNGHPSSQWDINGAGDPSIQGFATPFSIDVGQAVDFKINSNASDKYRIDIYRAGYYHGNGARKVETIWPSVPLPQLQPDCTWEEDSMMTDCGNWHVSASWTPPDEAISGVYFARLVRMDTAASGKETWRNDHSQFTFDPMFTSNAEEPEKTVHSYGTLGFGTLRNQLREPKASHIYFVVRSDSDQDAEVLFQTADTTWQAYNAYGNTSTYGSFDPTNPKRRSYRASYNRPFATRGDRAVNSFFHAEYPMVRFLERNGYAVTYFSGLDTARRGSRLLDFKLFLSVGHDEYWSGPQRSNVEAARDAGVHLAFFSGNEVYWRVRWEADAAGQQDRVMVIYKETNAKHKIDPHPTEWTGTWRDPSVYNPLGAMPENSLTGTIYTVDTWRNDPLRVPSKFSQFRFWRNTSIGNMNSDRESEVYLMRGLLGHEWDEDIDNGFRPAGLIHVSETFIDNVFYLRDQGRQYDSGSAKHTLTLYRHQESRALVFGAGTVQFAWGLDPHHDSVGGLPAHLINPCSVRVQYDPMAPVIPLQQAVINLFADMHVQPGTLEAGLVLASPSVDSSPPASNIVWIAFPDSDSPLASAFASSCIVIRGDAIDEQPGFVAGVEVFIEGLRWFATSLNITNTVDDSSQRFQTLVEWSFELQINGIPSDASEEYLNKAQLEIGLHSRAVDDSLNLEPAHGDSLHRVQVPLIKFAHRHSCQPVSDFYPRPAALLVLNDEADPAHPLFTLEPAQAIFAHRDEQPDFRRREIERTRKFFRERAQRKSQHKPVADEAEVLL